MAKTRKPEKKPSAHELLNEFLKENDITLALGDFKTSYTNEGMLIIMKPQIVAFYKEELEQKTNRQNGN